TRDIDVAVPRVLVQKERTVDELLKDAGLQDCFKNRLKPPAVSYVGRLGGTDVEVEFVTNESGNREGTRVVQPGLNATGLHYVDLLMESAFLLEVEVGGHNIIVRVPGPGSFIVQKALVFPQRPKPEKRAKDLYYIFDVWDGCREWREWIVAEVGGLRERRGSWAKRAAGNLDRFCGDQVGQGVAMLIEQRPATAFPDLNDDQFGQYAWGEMASLRAVLRG
ncbi:MAG: GSU2403 family nucleotidyltransferase fold protein, partial [Actinomycetota bacterium]|nr:GSU2403 family nucleotidyltransferase fold protein [Actinomycetota bacterium]